MRRPILVQFAKLLGKGQPDNLTSKKWRLTRSNVRLLCQVTANLTAKRTLFLLGLTQPDISPDTPRTLWTPYLTCISLSIREMQNVRLSGWQLCCQGG
jgi:hypothetical protein